MILEIIQFVLGLVWLIMLFKYLDKCGPDPMDYPQDYIG
jgi:hypothetical protein